MTRPDAFPYDLKLALSLMVPGPGEVVAIFALLAIITNMMGQYMCGRG